jgi:hypothetical protein
MSKTLVAGWFSFEGMGATAGDLLARDLVCTWLASCGHEAEVALAPPFAGGVDWRQVDPARFDTVVFVCGPFGNGWPVTEFMERFAGRRLIGLNLSMLEPLDVWNPFDLLIERDSSRTTRPDVTFLAPAPLVPVAGIVLVHPQNEYPGAMHGAAEAAIQQLISSREMAAVPIDTRLDENRTGLRTPAEVESLVAKMDVVLTTRLHGTVLAIKHGVPPLVIDPIAGGRKVIAQARAIGWPAAFAADQLDPAELRRAFDYCLSAEGRAEAARVRDRAVQSASEIRTAFISATAPARAGSV